MRHVRGGSGLALTALLALGALTIVLAGVAVARDDASGSPAALALHPVAGQFEPDDTTLEECSEQVCFEQAFGNLAFYRGPKVAMKLFDRRLAEDGDSGCHRIAHAIGAASLARYEGNVARTFAEGSASCWSGYYHGVLERSLLSVRSRTPAALAPVARDLCADAEVRNVAWLAYQCLHGLGHGLMITTGYDLPVSLDVCRRLATSWDRESCKGGVFMENMSSVYGVRSRWLRADDPLYPCNWAAESDKRRCYELVTTRILQVIGFDWERVAQICSTVETGWVASCYRSFGRDASAQNDRDPVEIDRLCAVARPYGGERECIAAAALDITANFASGKPASVLCDTTSARLRYPCYLSIGETLGRFVQTVAEGDAECRAITRVTRHVEWCMRGVRDVAS